MSFLPHFPDSAVVVSFAGKTIQEDTQETIEGLVKNLCEFKKKNQVTFQLPQSKKLRKEDEDAIPILMQKTMINEKGKTIKVTACALSFLFEHCAEILSRGDLVGYHQLCVSSKGKRHFDVFRRTKNTSTQNDEISQAQLRWIRLANDVGIMKHAVNNWSEVRRMFNFHRKMKALETHRKRGRKKRVPVDCCCSFGVTVNSRGPSHPSHSL